MNFSQALEAIKAGRKVQRAGWNGKGMFIFLVPGSTFAVSRPPLLGIYPAGTEIRYHAHVDMKTADGMIVPWLCSQTDLLAEDWQEVEEKPKGEFTCPRSAESGMPRRDPEGSDYWIPRGSGHRECSYCGSIHPDDFMQYMRGRRQVEPTDKDYKAYVREEGGRHLGKFYYQHLGAEQCKEFIQMLNAKLLNIAYPGHFYVLPFFMRKVQRGEDAD